MHKLNLILRAFISAILMIALFPITGLQTAKAQQSNSKNETIAFVGVNVIPMDKERVLKNQTVLIRAGRIAEIGGAGSLKVPPEALQIDGRGKFLMPGLVDMHVHLSPGEGANNDLPSQQLRLLLANGVTTIRSMIGNPSHIAIRDKINKGEILGPQVFTAGMPLLGNNTPTVEEAVKKVTEQKKAGFDLLKVHEGLKPEVYDAIVKTAREVGIPVAGHVTPSVGLNRALAAKQTSIEHLDNYLQSAVAPNAQVEITTSQVVLGETLKHVDEKKLTELARATSKAGVANNPTLTLFKLVVSDSKPEEFLKWEEMQYVPAQTRAGFAKQKAGTLNIPGSAEEKKRYIELRNYLVRELHKAGAKILLGPDSPQFFLVPGFAAHREMQSLTEAGLSNYAVLEAATRNGAENLGMLKEFGTIEKGKRADLLLLDANPLENIANAKKIAGVMVRGNWLPKENLAKMLEEVAALHRETKPQAGTNVSSNSNRRP
ncbi:MAG TPA: amidohydrolase family protein [Pyrinomonadaceae bacterium]|nr:amidohydrolase family protein [Pyrinomonadaceae bacterium]